MSLKILSSLNWPKNKININELAKLNFCSTLNDEYT